MGAFQPIERALKAAMAIAPLPAPRPSPLSPRRTDYLQAIADGLTAVEAAEQWGVSHQAVKNELRLIRQILGADTTAQAVAMGLRRGFIQ